MWHFWHLRASGSLDADAVGAFFSATSRTGSVRNRVGTYHRVSQMLSALGRHDEALAEFNAAYELDPLADYILGARFPLLEARREYDEALKQAEQFLRENKGNNSAARAYATFLYHKGNYTKVIELGEQTPTKDAAKIRSRGFRYLTLHTKKPISLKKPTKC